MLSAAVKAQAFSDFVCFSGPHLKPIVRVRWEGARSTKQATRVVHLTLTAARTPLFALAALHHAASRAGAVSVVAVIPDSRCRGVTQRAMRV